MQALGVLVVFVLFVIFVVALVRWSVSRPQRAPLAGPIVPFADTPVRSSPAAIRTAPLMAPPPAEATERIAVEVSLPGLKIVGESHYQEALEEIVGGRTDESADFEVDLSLVPESDNQYDSNAVGVEIDGEIVGYLSRASAKKYRAKFGSLTTHEWPARIVGGWDRGDGDRGSFGVQLLE